MPVLLDTHGLVWLLEVAPFADDALEEIKHAQAAKSLYVSPITAWEAGLAILKQDKAKRPNLLGLSADL